MGDGEFLSQRELQQKQSSSKLAKLAGWLPFQSVPWTSKRVLLPGEPACALAPPPTRQTTLCLSMDDGSQEVPFLTSGLGTVPSQVLGLFPPSTMPRYSLRPHIHILNMRGETTPSPGRGRGV